MIFITEGVFEVAIESWLEWSVCVCVCVCVCICVCLCVLAMLAINGRLDISGLPRFAGIGHPKKIKNPLK